MKVKKYWVVTATKYTKIIRKVYYAKNIKKAIDKFYKDPSAWYQNTEYVVDSVKPLEINLEVKQDEKE